MLQNVEADLWKDRESLVQLLHITTGDRSTLPVSHKADLTSHRLVKANSKRWRTENLYRPEKISGRSVKGSPRHSSKNKGVTRKLENLWDSGSVAGTDRKD